MSKINAWLQTTKTFIHKNLYWILTRSRRMGARSRFDDSFAGRVFLRTQVSVMEKRLPVRVFCGL
jgi:hypothetical protein